jgi:hypothetical protein
VAQQPTPDVADEDKLGQLTRRELVTPLPGGQIMLSSG